MSRVLKHVCCLLLCLLLVWGAGSCAAPEKTVPETSETHAAAEAETTEAPPLADDSAQKHYYNRLSVKEKDAYNAILSVIGTFPERIEVPVLKQEELNEMYAALLYDNPELFFVSGETILRQVKNRAYLYPDYRMDASDYEAMNRKCGEIAAQIADEARAKTSMFDRERAVHDRLIAMCSYTDDETNIYRNTIYGVLCGGEAACEGYAKTAKYLFDLLDIPCFVVHGNSTPPGSRAEGHMWNAVQLDGDWYYLDLTWDDPVLDKGGEVISYSYFNVTDKDLVGTHKDYDSGVECTATKDNFFVHEKLLLTTLDEKETERAAAYAAQLLDAGSDGFQLRFADKKSYDAAQKSLFENAEIYALLKQIKQKSQRSFATDRVSYFTADEANTIEIIVGS